MVSYYDSAGNEIARVHQYLRRDGKIGLSGKPDPKRLFENGVLYRIHKGTSEQPPVNALEAGAITDETGASN
jgi:hypothetical protein